MAKKKHGDGGDTVWGRVQIALKRAGKRPTQKVAATLLGIAQPSVSEWNQRGRSLRIEHAVVLAEKLNTCVEWLMTGRGPEIPGPPTDPNAIVVWRLWGDLPPDVRGRIRGIAEENAATKLITVEFDELSEMAKVEQSKELQRK